MTFDIGNALLTVGSDNGIGISGSEEACCVAIYAGVNGGTIRKPLGSTALNGGANVPAMGANTGPAVEEFSGNMRNGGGAAVPGGTLGKLGCRGTGTNAGSAEVLDPSLAANSSTGNGNTGADDSTAVDSSDKCLHH